MKSTKKYSIELMSGANTLCCELAILAARSNGGDITTLSDMVAFANIEIKQAPYSNEKVTVSLIGNTLLLDKETENLLIIEEREIMELEEVPEISSEEAKELLKECPTLIRQDNQ